MRESQGSIANRQPLRASIADGATPNNVRYTCSHGEHEVRIEAPRVGEVFARSVREEEAEFALVLEEPLIVLCLRFGAAVPWLAAPFSWHQVPREARVLPPAPGAPHEARALLHVELVETASGAVAAERNVTLWLHFSRALHEAIREQARFSYDPVEQARALDRLRRRYPSNDILAATAVVRSLGSP